VIYILKGRARMRWGEKLEFTAEAGPGDFIYVPPYVPVSAPPSAQPLLSTFSSAVCQTRARRPLLTLGQHQEINASADEKLECVLMRSDSEAIAVNLPDVEPVEEPTTVKWIDPTHPT